MKKGDDVLTRMKAANPVPDVGMIAEDRLAELAHLVDPERNGSPRHEPGDLMVVGRARGWWLRPLAAVGLGCVAIVVVVGLVLLAINDVTTVESPAVTTPPEPVDQNWSSLLVSTSANPAPTPARCKPSDQPDVPGPIDQARPQAGWSGALAGAFDKRIGLIILVDEKNDTWGFDVCTNTWRFFDPSGQPVSHPSGGLVYDVDSDVTVALGDQVAVYDAAANHWSQPQDGPGTAPGTPFGAVYEPRSGLIVTTVYPDGMTSGDDRMEAWAYDVDTNQWSLLGPIGLQGKDDPWQYDLVGYTSDLDRFILTPPGEAPQSHTLLLDPRTGERTFVWTDTPAITLAWPNLQFGRANDTVYVAGANFIDDQSADDMICGFDIAAGSWASCFAGPGRPIFGAFTWFGAMVEDPINNRMVLVNGVFGEFGAVATDHIWAIDLDTGEVLELLPEE